MRKRLYLMMDTNALVRLVHAIAYARYFNVQTPLRRFVEARVAEILVTQYIVEEAHQKIKKLVTKKVISEWNLPPDEIGRRLENELNQLLATNVVVVVDSVEQDSPYALVLREIEYNPFRRVMLRYRDPLLNCIRKKACSIKRIDKDLPIVEGILLAYDAAAVVPTSYGELKKPPFVVVTDDKDLFCSLYKCINELKGDLTKIILITFNTFKELIKNWFIEEPLRDQLYRWCLEQHCKR